MAVTGERCRVHVLGPLSLTAGDRVVPVGGALPRAFLGVVALESPRPVSLDRLTFLLWGDDPPAGVKGAVQQIATRVRRALAAAGLPDALHAVPPGYALDLDLDTVDARAFRSLARAGVEAFRRGHHAEAARLLSCGLELWHGAAFADLVDLPLATLVAPALDEERWRAEEMRAEALLAIGRPAEAAELLAVATAGAPLRERLWELQATALLAAGRQAEAVRCARNGVAVITAQLGVPPGPGLTAIESSLRSRAAATPFATGAPPAPPVRSDLLHSALGHALANAEQAARAASARYAHGEAVRQWERALELLDAVDPSDQRRRLHLLQCLGEAHNNASLAAEARTVFQHAVDLARDLDDTTGFARAVLGYCFDRTTLAARSTPAVLLEEALARLGPQERMLRGRLTGRLATEEYWTGSVDRAAELAEAALSVAEETGDVEGRLLAHYARAFARWTPQRSPELMEVCERYLIDAQSAGDQRHELLAHRWLVTACMETGELARAASEASLAIEMADLTGVSAQAWVSRVVAANHLLLAGELDRAEALATEALALGTVAEPEEALDYVSIFVWTVRWLQGRLDEIASLVEEAAGRPGADLVRRMGLALTHGELGRVDDARAVLDSVTAEDLDALPMNSTWYIALAAMAEAAAATGHARAAALVHDRLAPFCDRIAATTVTTTGPVAHHVGITAWTAGRRDEGIVALRDAVTTGDRIGAPVFAARSRLALAARLAELGVRDDARRLAGEAHQLAVCHSLLGVREAAARLVLALSPA